MAANSYSATGRLTFGQINLQRSRTAGFELRQVAKDYGLDIILIQEPYAIKGKIAGMGLRTSVLGHQPPDGQWPMAALAVPNERLVPMELLQYKSVHFSTMQIGTEIGKLYVISGYFQQSHAIDAYADQLDRILRKLRGNHIIIGVDANAKSELWHSRVTDDRGEVLEQLIEAHGLVIINREGQPSTHVNSYWVQRGLGETNIDVTLATPAVARRIRDWSVRDAQIQSDHRLITWSVELAITEPSRMSSRYSIRKANWPKVQRITENKLRNYAQQANDELLTEEIAVAFSDSVKTGCDAGIPKRRLVSGAVPWWNNDLGSLRRRLRKARKRFQRCCVCNTKVRLGRVYVALRNEYKRMISKSKADSFKEFVASMGNDNPWGIIYKLGADKLKIADVLTSLRKGVDGQWTMSIEETVRLLMDTLVPPDDITIEDERHLRIRDAALRAAGEGEEVPFTIAELNRALKQTKPKKSPGPDMIPPEVVRNWGRQTKVAYLELVNRCFEEGVFPRCWKNSELKVIRKAGDRDWSDPGNYRPISLLSVLGKVYERLIAERLQNALEGKLHDGQYGFTRGKGTVDAIVRVTEFVRGSNKKYVIGLFLDIKGAFDGVWWPAVIEKAARLGLSRNLVETLKSYLSERTVTLAVGDHTETREASKGCPQGSVLGPILWNLVFDDFLSIQFPDESLAVAYADDGLILVQANSRNEIETKFRAITESIQEWASLVKLQFSVNKTKLMNFGRQFHRERQPNIRLYGERVEWTRTQMYLGLLLDDRFSYLEHVKMVGEKAKNLFAKILRIARLKYGIRPLVLSTIYNGVFVPIVTYAARVWAHRANLGMIRKVLRRAQRNVLLGIIGAYRTTSFDAVTVVAGKIPVDLLVKEAPKRWEKSQGLTADSYAEIRRQTINEWQLEWDRSTTGRFTYAILPDISERLSITWLQPDYVVTQHLTSHGAYNSYLHRFGKSEEELCPCGQEPDGPEHLTYRCPDFEDERNALIGSVTEAGMVWPTPVAQIIRTEMSYHGWKEFISVVHRNRNV